MTASIQYWERAASFESFQMATARSWARVERGDVADHQRGHLDVPDAVGADQAVVHAAPAVPNMSDPSPSGSESR